MPTPNSPEELHQPVDKVNRRILGIYLFAVIPLLIACLGSVWASALGLVVPAGAEEAVKANRELSLVWAVVLLGALGGSLHALSSFAAYAGNRNLIRSWVWWYTARAPVGAALALVIYLVIRGGLMGAGTNAQEAVNPYGMGALAFLAGLFSEVATEKLREVFLALFRPGETKKDGIADAGPILGTVQPGKIALNAADTTVTVTGGGFAPTDKVLLGTEELATTFVSASELRAVIPAAKLKSAATFKLTVKRSGPRGVSSREAEIVVA